MRSKILVVSQPWHLSTANVAIDRSKFKAVNNIKAQAIASGVTLSSIKRHGLAGPLAELARALKALRRGGYANRAAERRPCELGEFIRRCAAAAMAAESLVTRGLIGATRAIARKPTVQHIRYVPCMDGARTVDVIR
jgi:hypothetical protein